MYNVDLDYQCDNVNRTQMIDDLTVKRTLSKSIRLTNGTLEAAVRVNNALTYTSDINTGVRQVDALSYSLIQFDIRGSNKKIKIDWLY